MFLLVSKTVFSQYGYTFDKSATNPFLYFKCDSVVLYKINRDIFYADPNQRFNILKGEISDTTYIDTSLVLEHKTLKPEEDSLFSNIIADTSSYGGATTSFIPNFQFVYYLKGYIVGWILLDYDANVLSSSFYISPKNYYNEIYEGENWVSPNNGFSTQGRKRLKYLFQKIGFELTSSE